jgi:hypothetical protein
VAHLRRRLQNSWITSTATGSAETPQSWHTLAVPASIDHRHLARLLAIGRIAIGVGLLVAPSRIGRGWVGEAAASGGGKVALRALGARDVALGYGTIRALDTGDPTLRGWVTACGLCDLSDSAATLVAFRYLPKRGRVLSLALAGGAAIGALAGRDRLD